MKIASHILCFNVDRFIKHAVANCHPHVDKIYLAWSPVSWGYGAQRMLNPTDIHGFNLTKEFPKCEIVEGEWNTEEEMRNACLDRAKSDRYDWLLTQDADEFYPDSSWIIIKNSLKNAPMSVKQIKTTWYEFWKSPCFVILRSDQSIKGMNAGFALRVSDECYFISKRLTSYSSTKAEFVLDAPCFHYGYVMSNEEMSQKIRTWGHANDFFTSSSQWFEFKWKHWSVETRYLNLINPCSWTKAILFPEEQPSFAFEIFGDNFLLPSAIFGRDRRSILASILESIYDLKALLKLFKSSIRKCL